MNHRDATESLTQTRHTGHLVELLDTTSIIKEIERQSEQTERNIEKKFKKKIYVAEVSGHNQSSFPVSKKAKTKTSINDGARGTLNGGVGFLGKRLREDLLYIHQIT